VSQLCKKVRLLEEEKPYGREATAQNCPPQGRHWYWV